MIGPTPPDAAASALLTGATKTSMQVRRRRLANPVALAAGELLLIAIIGMFYSSNLIDLNPRSLQMTGEHPESATLPILAEIGLRRYGEIPLWNPYMLTGFPHAGDFINHFWHPISTLPIAIWGGVIGMRLSVVVAFIIAGWGQWWLAHVFGLRGMFRLWAGILFMTSGALALYWRIGWYELLLGMAWFPWGYAALWWMARRRDLTSIVVLAGILAMIWTTGGGYYPLYFGVSGGLLLLMSMLFSPMGERLRQGVRAVSAGALSVGFVGVVVAPWIDGFRFTTREAAPDLQQVPSQPMPLALFNFVIEKFDWFNQQILGTLPGNNWFYIGAVAVFAALMLAPMALMNRRYRLPVVVMAALTVLLFAWHANRHTPIRYIYDFVPFLYTFRLVGRLLVVATCPLIIVGALGLQHLYQLLRRHFRIYRLSLSFGEGQSATVRITASSLVTLGFVLLLYYSARDVYDVNRPFAFPTGVLDPRSFTVLEWLKQQDPDLYYINIGGGSARWQWMPAAYLLEQPVINFKYNRELRSSGAQRAPGSPFQAAAKYQIAAPAEARPPNSQLLRMFEGDGVWLNPDALPFAFKAPAAVFATNEPITSAKVVAQSARIVGPNRVVVTTNGVDGEQLVALVSDYPGWSLTIDGNPAPVRAVNGYLGAPLVSGEHSYTFTFRPVQHMIGAVVSGLSLAIAVGLLAYDHPALRRRLPALPQSWPRTRFGSTK